MHFPNDQIQRGTFQGKTMSALWLQKYNYDQSDWLPEGANKTI